MLITSKLFEYLGSEDVVVNIIEAEYIPPYKIHLWFSDGAEQIVDFKSFLKKSIHGSIKKYLNEELFKNFSIAHGRLDWNDYDLCFSMQDLYEGTIMKNSSEPFGENRREKERRESLLTADSTL